MTPSDDTQTKAREVFLEIFDLPKKERSEALERMCLNQPLVRGKVLVLLKNADAAAEFLEDRPKPFRSRESDLGPGDRFGAYEIVRPIGSGGMGIIYLARQAAPSRSIALKLIRPDFPSHALMRRFEQEADVLGRLQHPGIAQVFEAGTIEYAGDPQHFMAMEYVEGVHLDDYVAAHKPGVEDLLRLIVKVCEALQHAHQKGIIHRDIKPSNILVNKEGEPKLVDFGIARVFGRNDPDDDEITRTGQIIGTVPYMSTEQVGGNPADIDTRSDVYSLGVVTYEMLCSELPYPVRNTPIAHAIRTINEKEPTPLRRHAEELHPDLETILAKALEKDREFRYQSAQRLGDDVRRFLRHEPVEARPASKIYLVSKFVRRHRALSASVLVTALVFTFGLIMLLHSWNQERHQRKLAETFSNYVRSILVAPDPSQIAEPGQRRRDLRVVDVLDKAAQTLGTADDFPQVEASMRLLLGATYRNLGYLDRAQAQLSRALELRRQGPCEPLEFIETLEENAHLNLDKGHLEIAEKQQEECVTLKKRELGDSNPATLYSEDMLTVIWREQGRLDEAEARLRSILTRYRMQRSQSSQSALRSTNNLASLLALKGELQEAEILFRDVLDSRSKDLPDEHPLVLATRNNLALLLEKQGRLEEAAEGYRDLVEAARQVYGEEHINTASSMNNLANVLVYQDKLLEAEKVLRSALAFSKTSLPQNHPVRLDLCLVLSTSLFGQGRLQEAESWARKGLEGAGDNYTHSHPTLAKLKSVLGYTLQASGRLEEALTHMIDAEEIITDCLGSCHQEAFAIRFYKAVLQRQLGRLSESLGEYSSLIVDAEDHLQPDYDLVGTLRSDRAKIYVTLGQLDEAESDLLEAYELAEESSDFENTKLTLEDLIKFYDQTNNEDEGLCFQGLLDELIRSEK